MKMFTFISCLLVTFAMSTTASAWTMKGTGFAAEHEVRVSSQNTDNKNYGNGNANTTIQGNGNRVTTTTKNNGNNRNNRYNKNSNNRYNKNSNNGNNRNNRNSNNRYTKNSNNRNNGNNRNNRNTNKQGQRQGQGQSQVANGGNATSNSRSNSNVTGSGNSRNNNVASGGAGGAGGNAQGGTGGNAQGGAASVDGNNSNVSISDNSSTVYQAQKRNPVNTAWAAPLTTSNDTCMGSTSAGAQGITFGLSFGSTWTDEDCVIRKDSRFLHNAHRPNVALSLMCEKETVRRAVARAGTPEEKRACGLIDDDGDVVVEETRQYVAPFIFDERG